MSAPPIQAAPPPSEQVKVDCLIEALEHATSSYKFLLLKIILQQVAIHAGKEELAIDIDTIRREMLILSCFPVRHFRLHFGAQDMIENSLNLADEKGIIDSTTFENIDQARNGFGDAKEEIAKLPQVKKLTRHPIPVMLQPWFEDLIPKGLDEYKRYKLIAKLSAKCFNDEENPPLYRIDKPPRQDGKIVVNPRWRDYFESNGQIINGWLDNLWQRFLAGRNPNVPFLQNKLWVPPVDMRTSLAPKREFWKIYLQNNELHCLYCRGQIDISAYDLDHFLPWSWIAHDQMWNLIPAVSNCNSAKSDKLPSVKLVGALAEYHFELLKFFREKPESGWQKLIDDYIVGLNVEQEDLKKQDRLANAYENTIKAQLALAKQQGFDYWREP